MITTGFDFWNRGAAEVKEIEMINVNPKDHSWFIPENATFLPSLNGLYAANDPN